MAESLDISTTLAGLTNAIQLTMASIHDLNTAVLNIDPFPKQLLNQFTNLRSTLKSRWSDDVSEVLRQIYKIMGDLIFLGQSVSAAVGQESDSDQECIILLQDIVKAITAVESLCRTAIGRNADISRSFEAAGSQFMPLRPGWRTVDISTRQVGHPVAPGLSAETETFVRSSLSAVYPDASSSACSTLSSSKDAQTHLIALSQFCIALRSICQTGIGGGSPSKQQATLKEICQAHLSSWRTSRQDVQTAISNLSRTIDAISIEPVLNPLQRRASYGLLLSTTVSTTESANVSHSPSGNPSFGARYASTPPVAPCTIPSRQATAPLMTYRPSAFASVNDAILPISSEVLVRSNPEVSRSETYDSTPSSCWRGFFANSTVKKRA